MDAQGPKKNSSSITLKKNYNGANTRFFSRIRSQTNNTDPEKQSSIIWEHHHFFFTAASKFICKQNPQTKFRTESITIQSQRKPGRRYKREFLLWCALSLKLRSRLNFIFFLRNVFFKLLNKKKVEESFCFGDFRFVSKDYRSMSFDASFWKPISKMEWVGEGEKICRKI